MPTSAAKRAASTPRRSPAKRAQTAPAPAAEAEDERNPFEPPGVGAFDLDAVKHEAEDTRFQFKAGGRLWYLHSPEELDWLANSTAQSAAMSEDLRPIVRLLLGEQYDEFVELPLTLGQVGTLFRAWQKHHGVTVPESAASRRS